MIRKTLTILSLIGLLLSVGLWGVSYWHFLYVDGKSNIFLKSGLLGIHRGHTLEQHLDVATEIQALSQKEGFSHLQVLLQDGYIQRLQGMIADNRKWTLFGFKWRRYGSGGPTFTKSRVFVPLWMPSSICASIFGLTYGPPIFRRRKRKRLGLCLKCGYDLRGSKDRCPECGLKMT